LTGVDEMPKTTKERLTEANKNIDKIMPDLWKKAENNLKKSESEYYSKK
jgi:hypothetical protein